MYNICNNIACSSGFWPNSLTSIDCFSVRGKLEGNHTVIFDVPDVRVSCIRFPSANSWKKSTCVDK